MTDPTTTTEPTLTELRERARELDVAGRSSMEREALVAAIADAELAAGAARDPLEPVLEPGTPEETGRPELTDVAEKRGARKPRRVIGTAPDSEDEG